MKCLSYIEEARCLKVKQIFNLNLLHFELLLHSFSLTKYLRLKQTILFYTRFIYSNGKMSKAVLYLLFETSINISSVYLLIQTNMHILMDNPYNCVLFLEMLVTSDTEINKIPKCIVTVSILMILSIILVVCT